MERTLVLIKPDAMQRGLAGEIILRLERRGLRIAGLGGCVRYNQGPHQHTPDEYDKRARHLLRAARDLPNVFVDLSGSGIDGGMLEACLQAVGVERLLWGADITLDTGWAKLRYLEHLLRPDQLERVAWRNAAGIFPPGSFEPR